MKKILMLGAALSLVSGIALAESVSSGASSSATPVATDGVTQVRAESDGPDGRGGPGGEWKRGKHHGKHAKGGKWGPGKGFGPSKGAHIVLERHGNRIDVKCAEGDSTQQCVDAVKNLMEQVAATMKDRGPRPGGPQPAPEGGPAPQP